MNTHTPSTLPFAAEPSAALPGATPVFLDPDAVREHVRQRYGDLADAGGSCCSPSCCKGGDDAAAVADTNADVANADVTGVGYGEQLGYSADELAAAPAGANLGLGCGNPLAIASIRPGETVVDLGSGAGFDCFLAARQLAGTGRVIGVDMTPAMIAKARANAKRSAHANVEFRLGEIEALPVADATADLILSNCVVNLSPDKPAVFREALRVLKPGGRLAIADIVATRPLPPEVRAEMAAIGACVGGAAQVGEVRAMLVEAGFAEVAIVRREESRRFINQWTERDDAGEFVVSAYITAVKPAGA